MRHITVWSVVSAALIASLAPAQDKPVALRGARVFTGQGSFTEQVTVVMQGGKIAAIGKDVDVPAGAELADCAGRFITPGLVDANTALGLPSRDENEESSEITPQLKVIEAIDPESKDFVRALRTGVTTVYVSPGGKNVFGGLGAIVKTAGEARVVQRQNGLRMTLGMQPGQGNMPFRTFGKPTSMYFRRPQNRMGTIWEVRRAFYDAMDARETGIGPVAEPTPAQKVLIKALDRKIPVRTTARADQDIRTALRLAEEFGIQIVIDGAQEASFALDYIVAAKVPVVFEPPSLRTAPDNAKPRLDTLELLSKAGVPVAIQTGLGSGSLQSLPLVREAAWAVRGGMNRDAALAAITSVPASILGIADRVGSLAPGKDADVVVWSRHPLSPGSRAEQVYVDGKAR